MQRIITSLIVLTVVALLVGSCALVTASPETAAAWQVETLLVGSGEHDPLYVLTKDTPGPLWASPAAHVRLLVSDDAAATWTPFAGGLPVAADCMVNIDLAYAASHVLYASTCHGLYAWDSGANAWVKLSDQRMDTVAVAREQPAALWATAHGDGVIRSSDGGTTWEDAGAGLLTFGGMANLRSDPRDTNMLYGVIRPEYAGSYLRRAADGYWETMPTPQSNAAIQTGLALDANSGALYVTTLNAPAGLWRTSNPHTLDAADVTWELVHNFGADVQASLLAAGQGTHGLILYANFWPLTPLDGGGASVGAPVLHRSSDGGRTWEPLATP